MPEIPTSLGRYQVLAKIAKGGMAEVYQAKALGIAGFERILAVKRILPHMAQQPRFIRSFIDEARIAVSLNHRNIVQVVDFGKSNGELYLAMELIDGVDLRTALKQSASAGTPMPMQVKLHILADIAAGLDYAHSKTDGEERNLGIVHCDISPQNVMLSRDGFVKILDFGVARAGFTSAPEGKRLRGKPRYMAPEQTRGENPTYATDIFALGIVAWELFTGVRLFDGKDLKSILRAVRREPSPHLRDVSPKVPAQVGDALARALSKNPEDRGNAADLAMVFARSARDLATSTMDKALASWLQDVFPMPEFDPTETQAQVPIPTPPDEVTEIQSPPRLAPASSSLFEERRVVVLGAYIDGGTEASQADLRRSLGMVAFKHGAAVHEAGDLTAMFGLEVAAEDDVAAAMHLALDAVELARETGPGQGPPLSLRIAALAGVSASLRDGYYHVDDKAISDTHSLARRAEPGRPLLAGGIGRRATARFAFRELPPVRIAGARLPMLELIGPTDFDYRARSLHDRRGRFFGRDGELRALEGALDEVMDHQSLRCVGVVGETGVGKSRLIAEFVARANARRPAPNSVAVAATPEAAEAPFALVGDVLQAALNLLPGRGESARSQLGRRLKLALAALGLPNDEIAEIVDTVDRALALRDGARLSAVTPPSHLLERVIAVLRRLSGLSTSSTPRLLILEDLHNADAASRAALAGLLAPPHRPGADLILATARYRDDLPKAHLSHIVELTELDDGDAEALLRDRLGDETTEISVVLERAGGNPLFIEELAEASITEGESEGPGSIRDVILARVHRLPDDVRTVLQYAAVSGPLFRRRIIDEVAPVDVGAALGELLEMGLIDPAEGFGGYGGEGEYQFRHGLIRDVVYDSLTADARRETHARIGQLLATRYAAGRDEPPAIVAKHLELGGHVRLAGDYWQASAVASLEASFAEAAVLAFNRCIELYGRSQPVADKELVEALVGRARANLLLGDHSAAGDDLDALVRRSLEPATRVAVAVLLAERALRLGDFDAARAAADEAERTAEQTGSQVGIGEALRIRGEAHERLGDYERAATDASRAIEVFEGAGLADKKAQAQLGLGRVHLMQARYRAAQEAYEPVLRHLEKWPDPWAERLAKNHVAVIELCMGNFEVAWDSARESLAICERYGDRARAGDNHSVSGIILSEVGQFEEAAQAFAQALEIQGETGSKWARADCLLYAGLNDHRSGRSELGRDRINEAISLSRTIGARYIEANALCALTEALLASDGIADLGRALDAAVAASEIARETGLVSAEILAQSRLAQATAQTGDLAQAVVQSAKAMARLKSQEFIEGPEEEVYFADYQLRNLARMRGAQDSLDLALATVNRKLHHMENPAWRRSYRQLARTAAILSLARPA